MALSDAEVAAARARTSRVLRWIGGAVAGLVLLALGIELAVDGPRGFARLVIGGPPPSTLPPASAEEVADETRERTERLWTQARRQDDAARARALVELLERAGQRCDSVQSALMRERGTWLVGCAPGYRYRLEFGSVGQLMSLHRLP